MRTNRHGCRCRGLALLPRAALTTGPGRVEAGIVRQVWVHVLTLLWPTACVSHFSGSLAIANWNTRTEPTGSCRSAVWQRRRRPLHGARCRLPVSDARPASPETGRYRVRHAGTRGAWREPSHTRRTRVLSLRGDRRSCSPGRARTGVRTLYSCNGGQLAAATSGAGDVLLTVPLEL